MSKRQWAGWGQAGQPQQHYLIEPRHLAGGGNIRHVTEYLRHSGWRDHSAAGGTPAFESPDRSVRVGYTAEGWTISGTPSKPAPAWHATLTPQTPVEIVAGVTDALTRPRTAHAPNPWAPLQQQRWKSERLQYHTCTATSPDNAAWLRYQQAKDGNATWMAGARTEHGATWQAMFTPTTPMHLIQAFSTSLASPEPVMRPRGHVPPTRMVRATSVSVLPQQLSAWQQARLNTARAAAWARNSWASNRPRTRPPQPSPYAGTARTRT
ncbi:DUF317 domain-containing protein [Streptomyces diacarni]|uniref:DUF317 domain-containing protein n=1 Tax=Streptomyces diacarni TaxID=2800381 RepID=UPI0034005D8F